MKELCVCGNVMCDKFVLCVCVSVVCDNAVSVRVVCDKEWCERRAAGGGRQRRTGAEQKTRTPHNDVGQTGINEAWPYEMMIITWNTRNNRRS